MLSTDFSHVPNFTGYMAKVYGHVCGGPAGQRILDIPAGNGLLATELRKAGHEVVCADINRERSDYVFADLNGRLPFDDASFDTVTCLEGLEHVLDPQALIGELVRITRSGGRVVLSTPNLQNAFSRLRFFATGFHYQYGPWMCRQLAPGEQRDRGHIAPMTYLQIRYHFHYRGARVEAVDGDKWKRKWLVPFLYPVFLLGRFWASRIRRAEPDADPAECDEVIRQMNAGPLLFSRSLIVVARVGQRP
jgi:SAM-dependent methyltransferase